MRLAERLGRASTATPTTRPPGVPAEQQVFVADSREDMASIAQRLHQKILDRLDLAQVSRLSADELRPRLRSIVDQIVIAERISIADGEAGALAEQVLDELTGHGPLEGLLNDETVSDVLVNRIRPGLRRAQRQARA